MVQPIAIYRLDPLQNAVVTVSTWNVSRGTCGACYRGVVATVYRDSWDWVVGSGDVLDEAAAVLSDDILLEAGATYFIVLRWEHGPESPQGHRPRSRQSLEPSTWDRIVEGIGVSNELVTYDLRISYKASLTHWAQVSWKSLGLQPPYKQQAVPDAAPCLLAAGRGWAAVSSCLEQRLGEQRIAPHGRLRAAEPHAGPQRRP